MPPFYISDWKENFFEKIHAFTKIKSDNKLQNTIMIFPTMRSKRIAIEYFQEMENNSYLPEMLTSPEFYTYCQEVWLDEHNLKARSIDSLESIALLFDIVYELAQGTNENSEESNLYSRMLSHKEENNTFFDNELKSFKHFYSYGQYLHKIIQECFDENNHALSLHYADDEVNEFASYLLENLRAIFTSYQQRLELEGLTSSEYLNYCLAQKIEKGNLLPLFEDKILLFCGIDQISASEELCLKHFHSKNAYFLFSTDSALVSDYEKAHWSTSFYKEWAQKWQVHFDYIDHAHKYEEDAQFFFHQAFDTHSQFQNFSISSSEIEEKSVACILNSTQTLMPLLYKLNNNFSDEKLNVTMGYPLKESRLYNLVYLFDIIKQNSRKFEVKVKVKTEEKSKKKATATLEKKSKKEQDKLTQNFEEKIFIRQCDLIELCSFPFFNQDENFPLSTILKNEFEHIEKPYISLHEDIFSNQELNTAIQPILEVLKLWFEIQTLSDIIYCISNLEHILNPLLHSYDFERLALRRLINKSFEWSEKQRFIDENLGYEICSSLVFEFFGAASLAFEHHSNKALQILGLRETKLLALDTIHIFDANDDTLPPRQEENPLLPEKLRLAIGLKSLKANEVYTAHTWYRLLASAQNIHIYWQESSVKTLFDDKKVPSPYVEEALWKVEQKKGHILKPDSEIFTQAKCIVELIPKELSLEINKESKQALHALCNRRFSPTLLDTFLACPLKFFYQNIMRLQSPSEIKEGEDARLLGNLVHHFMQGLYKKTNTTITQEELKKRYLEEIANFDNYLKEDNLLEILPAESLFLLKTSFPNRLSKYINNQPTTFVKAIEKEYSQNLDFTRPDGNNYTFYGKIDRIDERTIENNKSCLILDYKTGSVEKKIHNPKFWQNEELFNAMLTSVETFNENNAANILHALYKSSQSLQMPIYLFLTQSEKYHIRNAAYIDLYDSCEEKFVLDQSSDNSEILDTKIPIILKFITHYLENITTFSKTEHSPCGWCPYNVYCN